MLWVAEGVEVLLVAVAVECEDDELAVFSFVGKNIF
uniref:Uncharacterized protein n=1 Tax=Rhizophora mucronata TaxID=61149 RepID=A0A2P2PT02_RHIMU